MNRPPKGDIFRRGNSDNMMFQPMAQDVPDMSIKIREGSFWLNGTTFVEYSGGSSPKITVPSSGAKWALIVINKMGVINIINGKTVMNNPELPEISRNVMPIAAVYIKSSTKTITTDMIYDVRPTLAAGGYPLSHNQVTDRNVQNAHTIDSITNLSQVLEDKVNHRDLDEALSGKADIDGTVSATFTLNQDDTGVPVEYCGININRGSMPDVGIRFNEDADKWQYTNDGSVWYNLGDILNANELANSYTAGLVKTSVDPIDSSSPTVVSVNDPLFISISDKADKSDLLEYYKKDAINNMLDKKVDIEAVYSKSDAENIFLTRADYSSTSSYSKGEINDMLAVKANKSEVYTKSEVDNLFDNYYTKEEISSIVANGGSTTDLSGIYTKSEVDNLFDSLENEIYTKSEVENLVANKADKDDLDKKANSADVYTKAEIDKALNNIQPGSGTALSNVYTKSEIDILLNNKASATHTHNAHESIIQDECHRFVSDDEISKWNNKLDKFNYTPEDSAKKGAANGYASLDINGKIPVSQLPAAALGGSGSALAMVVDTYSDLLNLQNIDTGTHIFVKDASGDTTVDNGWAEYIVDQDNNFTKIGEKESVDFVLDWENVTNKPEKFIPTDESLEPYAKTEDIYTKLQVDNLLALKSSSDHTHDNVYTKTETDTLLNNYLKSSDVDVSKIHDVNTLGTVSVDETDKADGKVLAYRASDNKLVYITPAAGSESGSGSTTPVEVDYYKLGTKTVDETDIADGKVLAYNSEIGKVVYKALPDNLLSIDNTNKADGKVLTYSESEDKLVYSDVSGSGSEYKLYTFTPIGASTDPTYGPICQVTADSENVTFTKNGLNVAITPGNKNVRLVSAIVKFTEAEMTNTSNVVTIDYNSLLTDTDYANMYIPQVQVFRGEPGSGNQAYYSNVKFNLNTNAHTIEFTALPSDGFTIRLTY